MLVPSVFGNDSRETKERDDDARWEALRVIERWRHQGFDTVLCHFSGFCMPANSTVLHDEIPNGYRAASIDSAEAITTLATFITSGGSYRV